jgi:hypothetical protein
MLAFQTWWPSTTTTPTTKVRILELVLCSSCLWSWRCFASIDPLRRCFAFLDSVPLDLYPACAEELYSDVVIILCNPSFIPVLYGFVPLGTGIARDSHFLGLSRRCKESGFRSRKFGSFHIKPHIQPTPTPPQPAFVLYPTRPNPLDIKTHFHTSKHNPWNNLLH